MLIKVKNQEEKLRRQALMQRIDFLELEVGRYERIFRGSHGYGFVNWDLINSTMSWNGRFWQYLGYSESDMKAISDPDKLIDYLYGDDAELLLENIRALIKGAKLSEVILRVKKKNGGFAWAAMRVDAERAESGWVNHIAGIIFDVSKLKLAEQALLLSQARHERIIQSSRDGIWEWSAEEGEFHFSARCWELLGYEGRDDELTAGVDRWEAWQKLMHPDDLKKFGDELKSHMKFGVPLDVEYRARASDGSWRWVRGRGQAELNEKGETVRLSGTNMDITAIKDAEARVIRAKEQAENANKAKSEFLSSMSHELRTPLNAILGFAKVLSTDENLTREQRTSMREVIRAGNHLLQLVNDVLDLARIEAGRMQINLETLYPVSMMHECIELVRPEASKRDISIELQAEDNANTFIVGDKVRLRQVFLNLLSNAVKYNNYNGYVRIVFDNPEEKKLRIAIEDSGKGISDKAKADIFKPFNRLGEEGSNIEGAGIGLVITKTLVEQMDGAIDFDSKEKRGSTFWLTFPCESAVVRNETPLAAGSNKALASELQIQQASRAAEQPMFDQNLRVLYVEDNLANQRVFQQMLSRYREFSLTLCSDPLESIYLARTDKPDLIVLDIDLSGLSGHDVVKVLKQDEETRNIPVVALSAKAMAHDIEVGLAAGFDEYLTKPFELDTFLTVCNDLFVRT